MLWGFKMSMLNKAGAFAMPITLTWDSEKKNLLVWNHVGQWTWQQFFDTAKEAKILLDCTPDACLAIYIPQFGHNVPEGPFIRYYRNMFLEVANSAKIVFLVGQDLFTQMIVVALTHRRNGARHARTLEDTRSMMDEYKAISKLAA
jgi:hypothetical protein